MLLKLTEGIEMAETEKKLQSLESEMKKKEADEESLKHFLTKRDVENLRTFLKSSKIDINQRIENLLENRIDGPAILVAINKGDERLAKMLVQEFGANVNQEICIEGKQSTPLIFAMSSFFK